MSGGVGGGWRRGGEWKEVVLGELGVEENVILLEVGVHTGGCEIIMQHKFVMFL